MPGRSMMRLNLRGFAAALVCPAPYLDYRKALADGYKIFLPNVPHVLGWMVHVYPYESDPKNMWATNDDDHGHDNMDHSAMPGMKINSPGPVD